jgi:hypothetical protein
LPVPSPQPEGAGRLLMSALRVEAFELTLRRSSSQSDRHNPSQQSRVAVCLPQRVIVGAPQRPGHIRDEEQPTAYICRYG